MNVLAAARPFTPAPIDGRGLGVRAADRLGREYGSSAGAQPGDGGGVEDRHELRRSPRSRGARARRGRQAFRRVPGKRRHPLERGVAAAERGHRAEVAGRVGGHVDLRRHRPLAALVRDERLAHGLERALGRDSSRDVGRPKERDWPRQSALTAETSFSTEPSRRRTASRSSGRRTAGCRCRRSRGSSIA